MKLIHEKIRSVTKNNHTFGAWCYAKFTKLVLPIGLWKSEIWPFPTKVLLFLPPISHPSHMSPHHLLIFSPPHFCTPHAPLRTIPSTKLYLSRLFMLKNTLYISLRLVAFNDEASSLGLASLSFSQCHSHWPLAIQIHSSWNHFHKLVH